MTKRHRAPLMASRKREKFFSTLTMEKLEERLLLATTPTAPLNTPGLYNSAKSEFQLHSANAARGSDTKFVYGTPGNKQIPFVGDFNGDKLDTVGLYNAATSEFTIRNENSAGPAQLSFVFGQTGVTYQPVVGDWDGDGIDTVGLFDPATGQLQLRNSNTAGSADLEFTIAVGTNWKAIAGDWDGDGKDIVGLYDPARKEFHLLQSNAAGATQTVFAFGGTGIQPLAGDWNGDGQDTVGVYDRAKNTYSLRNNNTAGKPDISFTFGKAASSSIAIVGNWTFSAALPVNGVYTVPGAADQHVTATLVARNASLKSEVGIFPVDDASGRIGTLKPGDKGYVAAALNSPGRVVIFSPNDGPGKTAAVQFMGGSKFAMYLIDNNTTENFLRLNPQDAIGKKPLAYFTIKKANPDKFDHVRYTLPNQFGWEDQKNGGDKDFNDVMGRIDFSFMPTTPADNSRPVVVINTPTPDQLTNQAVTVRGKAMDDSSGVARVQASLDGGGLFDVAFGADGSFQFAVTLALNGTQDGRHTFVMRATDKSGNVSADAVVSFVLDTIPPPLSFDLETQYDTAPLGDRLTRLNPVNLQGQTEAGRVVEILKDGQVVNTTTSGGNGAFTFAGINLVSGANPYMARTSDAAGNLVQLSVTFLGDFAAPVLTLTSPAPNLLTNQAITIAGSAVDDLTGLRSIQAKLDSGQFFDVPFGSGGGFQFPAGLVLNGSNDGTHSINLRATDGAGNTSIDVSRSFTLDTLPPAINIASPIPGTQTDHSPIVLGQVVDGVAGIGQLQASIDAGPYFDLPLDAEGRFTIVTTFPEDGTGDGRHVIQLKAVDRAGNASAIAQTDFTLNTANHAPSLNLSGDQIVNEEQALQFTVTASDDRPESLSYSLDLGAPTGAHIDPLTGVFQWTPSESQGPGSFEITLRVTDEALQSDAETITIVVQEVNRAPVLAAIDLQQFVAGSNIRLIATATDPDQPANVLTFGLGLGAPTEANIDPQSGVFTWTPTTAGTYEISLQVVDSGGLSDARNVSFLVVADEPGNHAPAIIGNPEPFATEGVPYFYEFEVQDRDPNDVIRAGANAPQWLTIDQIAPRHFRLSGTPTNSDVGNVILTVQAEDSSNGANGIAEKTFAISVFDQEDPPSAQLAGELLVAYGYAGFVERLDGVDGKDLSALTPLDGIAQGAFSKAEFGPDGNLYVIAGGGGVLRYDGASFQFLKQILPGRIDDLVFGPTGDLFVTSASFGNQILHYTSEGEYRGTFVGNGSGGLDVPGGMAFGPDGNFYVANRNTVNRMGKVLRFDGVTGDFLDDFVAEGSGGLTDPRDLLFDSDGNLLVVGDDSKLAVYEYDLSGQFMRVVHSTTAAAPSQAAFAVDGSLLVRVNDLIERFQIATGAWKGVAVFGLGAFGGIAVTGDGQLYVTNDAPGGDGPETVSRYDGTTFAHREDVILSNTGGLDQPEYVHVGPDGFIYTSDINRGIYRTDPTDGTTGRFTPATFGIHDFRFGPDGKLYVLNNFLNSIDVYDGTTGVYDHQLANLPDAGVARSESPIVFGPDGNLYLADTVHDRVVRYNPSSDTFLGDFIPSQAGGLHSPAELAFGPDGKLYVASDSDDNIVRFDAATGAFIDVFVSRVPITEFSESFFWADGNYYVTSGAFINSDEDLLRIDAMSGSIIARIPLPSLRQSAPQGVDYKLPLTKPIQSGDATAEVRVFYSDDAGIDLSSIDDHDLLIRGPNDFAATGRLVSREPRGHGALAVYEIAAPGGVFDPSDNGTYQITMLADAVFDRFGLSVSARVLGSISIDLRPTVNAPPTVRLGGDLLLSYYRPSVVDSVDLVTGETQGFVVPESGVSLTSFGTMRFGPDGDFYVASGPSGVLRFNGATFELSGRAASTDAENFVFGPDGLLYVIPFGLPVVERFDPHTGVFIDRFVDLSNSPDAQRLYGMAFGSDGTFYLGTIPPFFVGAAPPKVLRFDSQTRNLLGELFDPSELGVTGVSEILRGPNNLLYVIGLSGIGELRLLRFDSASGLFVDQIATNLFLGVPGHAEIGSDGHLYVKSIFAGSIYDIDPTTGHLFRTLTAGTSFALDSTGDLFISHTGDVSTDYVDYVSQYDANTGTSIGNVIVSNVAGFGYPADLTIVGPDGFIYLNRGFTGQVYRTNPIDHTTASLFDAQDPITDMEFGPDGNLYVATRFSENLVSVFDPRTGDKLRNLVHQSPTEPIDPTSLAFGPDEKLYLGDANNEQILRFDRDTGEFVDVFISNVPSPFGLLFTPGGNLFVQSAESRRYNAYTGQELDAEFAYTPSYLGYDGNVYVVSQDFSHFTGSVRRIDGGTGELLPGQTEFSILNAGNAYYIAWSINSIAITSPLTNPIGVGDATARVRLAFVDSDGIDVSTIGDDDIVVTSPNGDDIPVRLISALDHGDTLAAVYEFAAPRSVFTSADNGRYEIRIHQNAVFDRRGAAVSGGSVGSFPVVVTAFNLAPQIIGNPGRSGTEDVPYEYRFHISDGNVLDTVGVTAHLPAWLQLENLGSGDYRLQGVPDELAVGTSVVDIIATDNTPYQNNTTDQQFRIVIADVNDAPRVRHAIPDLEIKLNQPALVTVADQVFADDDTIHGDALTLSVAGLPPWLTFSGGHLAGVPSVSDAGTYSISVTAIDRGGLQATDVFTITVVPQLAISLFADPQLERSAAQALGLPDYAVLSAEAIGLLTTLVADSTELRSLEGLQYATNLQQLELSPLTDGPEGDLASLSTLSSLPRLEELTLQHLHLTSQELATLGNAQSLKLLDLRFNDITSLSSVSGFSSLESIRVYGNPVSDFRPLAGSFIHIDAPPADPDQAQSVAELASVLNGLPLSLYEYVANNFAFEAYAGVMKSTQSVLETKAGNAWDQARLLGELLSHSGVQTRFVTGRIRTTIEQAANLVAPGTGYSTVSLALAGLHPDLDAASAGISFDHAWLEAELRVPGQGTRWVRLDPAWKMRDHQPGVTVPVTFDVDDYRSSLANGSPDDYFTRKVSEYLSQLDEPIGLDEIPFSGPIIPRYVVGVSESLPYTVVTSNQPTESFNVFDNHRLDLSVSDQTNNRLFTHTVLLGTTNLESVVFGYDKSAGMFNLWLDGRVVESVRVANPGEFNPGFAILDLAYFKPNETAADFTKQIGLSFSGFTALSINANQVSDALLARLRTTITENDLHFLSNQPISVPTAVVPVLSLLADEYWFMVNQSRERLGALTHVATSIGLEFGVFYSDYGYRAFSQQQIVVQPNSVSLNVLGNYRYQYTLAQTYIDSFAFSDIVSFNEGRVFEEVLNRPGLSTVSSFQYAGDHNIPVLHINASNRAKLLPQLTLPSFMVAQIAATLDQGIPVTVPRDMTPINGFNGVGWQGRGMVINWFQATPLPLPFNGGKETGNPDNDDDPDNKPDPENETHAVGSPCEEQDGNPVEVYSGNRVRDEVDFLGDGGVMPLRFARHYDSLSTLDIGLGVGWLHTYSHFLTQKENGDIVWTDDVGNKHTFAMDGNGGYLVEKQIGGTFIRILGGFIYRTLEGTQLRFNAAGRLIRITDRNENVQLLQYNTAGRLVEVSELGNPTRHLVFGYQGDTISAVTDSAGRIFRYAHQLIAGKPYLVSVTQPSVVTQPDVIHRFGYYSSGPLQGLLHTATDPDGNQSQYTYYGNRRAFQTIHPDGSKRTYSFEFHQMETRVTDEAGNPKWFRFDCDCGLTSERIYSDGTHERMKRDDDMLLVSMTDRRNQTTTYDHDGRGAITKVVNPAGDISRYTHEETFNQLTRVTTQIVVPSGAPVTTDFTGAGLPKQLQDRITIIPTDVAGTTGELVDVNVTIDLDHDLINALTLNLVAPWGQRILLVKYATLTGGGFQGTIFDSDASTTVQYSIAPSSGSFRPLADLRILNGHPADGTWSLEIEDAEQQASGILNGFTLQLTTQIKSEVDFRTAVYDVNPGNGNTLSVRKVLGSDDSHSIETDDLTTHYAYSPRGQVELVQMPEGRLVRMKYDDHGRVIQQSTAEGTAIEAVSKFEYDIVGNRVATIDPRNNRTTYSYDTRNRLQGMVDAENKRTDYKYDLRGNVIETHFPDGTKQSATFNKLSQLTVATDGAGNSTQYFYDIRGNQTHTVDGLGNTIVNTFDIQNRLLSTQDADNGLVHYSYDGLGRVTAIVDPVGNRTRFAYDKKGRLTKETDPLGFSTRYAYDASDNLTSKTDRDGRTTEYVYDSTDRVITERWLTGQAVENTIHYAYDGRSNLMRANDNFSSLTFRYDTRNQVTSVDNQGTPGAPHVVLAYAYDSRGNVTSVSDTINGDAGATTGYLYDTLNRVRTIIQAGASTSDKRVEFSYNPSGQYAVIKRFGDLSGQQPVAATTYTYDSAQRLQSIDHRNAQGTLLDFFHYTYDTASRVKTITDIDGITAYGYDNHDQLVSANHADPVNPDEFYEYDANGNRTSSQLSGTYTTSSNNRLLTDGTYSYAYDREGNTIRRTEIATGSYREFTWDFRNRLIAVVDKSATGIPMQIVHVTYDVLNRRISESVDNVPADATDAALLHFIYDREDVILDFQDADGSNGPGTTIVAQRYLHGPGIDQVLAQDDAEDTTHWNLTDHLGSTRDVVSNTGIVVNHLRYASFGDVTAQTNANASSRHLFAGREFDAALGIYYSRARYLDPSMGRFLSEDPLGLSAGNPNLFRYASNNPVSLTDPTGLCDDDSRNWIDRLTQLELDSLRWLLGDTVYSELIGSINSGLQDMIDATAWIKNGLDSGMQELFDLITHPALTPLFWEASFLKPIGAATEGAAITAQNGTKITGYTMHGIDRAIGDGAKRAGVKPSAILDALKNPTKIASGVDKMGRPFQVFTGQDARVVVNPQTGQIVSLNPLGGSGVR